MAVTARGRRPRTNGQAAFALPPPAHEHLTITQLETWLWDAACAVRGAADAPKFKDFILPLVFFKRLSDVFDDELARQVAEWGDEQIAREVIEADHEDALRAGRRPIAGFSIPRDHNWRAIRNHSADGTLGEFVTDAMRAVARHNLTLDGVVNVRDDKSARAASSPSTTSASPP